LISLFFNSNNIKLAKKRGENYCHCATELDYCKTGLRT